jgi:hypothetical protein
MFEDKEVLKNNIIIHNIILNPTKDYFNNYAIKVKKYLDGMSHSFKYYEENRATTFDKAREDHKVGKISEVFADRFLKETYGFPGGGVDFTVKKNTEKDWRSDLEYKDYPDFKFAVKGCPRTYKCPRTKKEFYSWMFAIGNKHRSGGRDPILNKNNKEICVFVINKDFNNIKPDSEIRIFASAPMFLIFHLFEDPIYPKYRGIKKAIRLQNIYKESHLKYKTMEKQEC